MAPREPGHGPGKDMKALRRETGGAPRIRAPGLFRGAPGFERSQVTGAHCTGSSGRGFQLSEGS